MVRWSAVPHNGRDRAARSMAVAPKAEAVAQATEPPPKGPGEEAKEQGNAHFKAKEYLKAAAN